MKPLVVYLETMPMHSVSRTRGKSMRTLTVKLYNDEDCKYLNDMINVGGIIYNTALTIIQDEYKKEGKLMRKNDLQKILKDIRNSEENSFWQMVGSQAVQDITDRIYRSYNRFLKDREKGIRTSPPKRKKVKKYKSVTYKQSGYKFLPDRKVRIGNHIYRYWDSYDGLLETVDVHTMTIKRNILGEYFLFMTVDASITMGENRDGRYAVGMDFGLRTFLTLSDGTRIESPQFFRKGIKEIRKASKELSRKEEGSNGYVKAQKALYRRHEHVANCRRDWFFKLAHELCSAYSVIVIEDLNIKGMARLWGRKVNDYAYSEFVRILEWIALKHGTVIERVDRFYPSLQTCSRCGALNTSMKDLRKRTFKCEACSLEMDRDENAAVNLKNEGLRMLNKLEVV